MTAFLPELSCCAENREVAAFGAATGKDDFAWFAAPNVSDAVASIIQKGARAAADVMNAGRVAVDIAKVREHRLFHGRIERSSGVVIEINRPHDTQIGQALQINNWIWDDWEREPTEKDGEHAEKRIASALCKANKH